MVSASSDKQKVEFDRTAFKYELKWSVLLDINCQVDDTPECKTGRWLQDAFQESQQTPGII